MHSSIQFAKWRYHIMCDIQRILNANLRIHSHFTSRTEFVQWRFKEKKKIRILCICHIWMWMCKSIRQNSFIQMTIQYLIQQFIKKVSFSVSLCYIELLCLHWSMNPFAPLSINNNKRSTYDFRIDGSLMQITFSNTKQEIVWPIFTSLNFYNTIVLILGSINFLPLSFLFILSV